MTLSLDKLLIILPALQKRRAFRVCCISLFVFALSRVIAPTYDPVTTDTDGDTVYGANPLIGMNSRNV